MNKLSCGIATGTAVLVTVAAAGAAAALPTRSGSDQDASGRNPAERLIQRSVVRDADGTTYTRYDRTYNVLRVIGGDLIVKRTPKGQSSTTYNAAGRLEVPSATARMSPAAAERIGHQLAERATLTKLSSSRAELVVHAGAKGARLAYDVATRGVRADQTPSMLHTIIDASSGKLLTASDEVKTGTGNSMYSGTVTLNSIQSGSSWLLKDSVGNYTTDLNGSTSGTGTQFTDADNVWGSGTTSSRQTAGVDAQFGAEKTFGYFKNVLGRNGIWNNGTGARSRVHYGNSYNNAFWDGTQMTYGDGTNNAKPLTELDVAAHEMSHGVTENTANLDYGNPQLGIYKESGGLNESTSDIFGVAVEFYVNSAADPGDYFMGEKIDLRGNGTPLRYLDKPSKDGSSLDCYNASTIKVDPHYSSGPLNHWFFMASEGSGARTVNGVSYNSPTCGGAPAVTGAGRANIEKVWYRTLSTKLTSTSGYAAAREGAITSAIELFGATSQTCLSVQAAFNAITVPAGSASCGGTQPPTGGNLLQNPGFESGATIWTGTAGPITTNTGRPARTGSWKMWLGGNGSTSSEYEQQTVTIPATAAAPKLSFWVRIDTSESSTAGTAYDTMKPQIVSGGVTSTLATYSNLTTTGGAYAQKVFDLSAYKGKTITVKFTMSEDSSLQTSFVVDDTAVTTG